MFCRWRRRWGRSRPTCQAVAGQETGVDVVVPLQPGDRVQDTFDTGQVDVLEPGWWIGDVKTRDAQHRRLQRMEGTLLDPGCDLGADTREALGLLHHDAAAGPAD